MKKRNVLMIFSTVIFFALLSIASGSSDSSGHKQITDSAQNASSSTDSLTVPDSSASPSASASQITIEEQVLIDESDLKVTATEYVLDSIWGDGIKLLIENSGSSDIGLNCQAVIVNDYMITDLFSSTVAAGKKSNETLNLSTTQLKAAGIENVGQIELYFHTFDPDSFSSVKNYPCSVIKTSVYDKMDVVANDEGKELYHDSGVRIVGKYVDEDSFWGSAVLLYIENNCGKNIIVQCDDLSVNGYMITPFFSSTVYDGKKAMDEITLLSNELESNGITAIEEIELKFQIIDENYTTISETDPISFSVN